MNFHSRRGFTHTPFSQFFHTLILKGYIAKNNRFSQHKDKVSGFTLIELLVVIAIIGLLSSIAMVAMTNSRIKSRDTARFATMYQVKNGLDIYYNTGSGYPDQSSWDTSQNGSSILTCSGTAALKVPQDMLHDSDSSYAFTYTPGGTTSTGCGGTVYGTYKIEFKTEGPTSYGPAGTSIFLSPSGYSTVAPF
jgi:type IV pilus assembly protein PilA